MSYHYFLSLFLLREFARRALGYYWCNRVGKGYACALIVMAGSLD
jgi:hypothetical protein